MDEFNKNINTEPEAFKEDLQSDSQQVQQSEQGGAQPAPPQMPQNTGNVGPDDSASGGNFEGAYSQNQPPRYAPPGQNAQYTGAYYQNNPRQGGQPYQNQPPYGAYPQGVPNYYPYGGQKPPKQPMSAGLKAFVIIAVALLVVCLAGFISFVAINSGKTENNFDSFGGYEFTVPSIYEENTVPTQATPEENSFKQSDAQKETDPSYSGLKLESKPKDAANSKYNAGYSFDKLQSSVVGVICYASQDADKDYYASQGSGIVVTTDGYIVTNSHVINNSRTDYIIKVVTSDKKEYDAGVVGYDSRTDLAVLKINATGLTAAAFGDSNQIEITEDVVAIGNPRGINFQNSVTKGIVSAVNREASATNNAKFIQIDAPINPGNSGGPLCNMFGQVIGINTSKIVIDEYEGMGFAIPSATVKDIVDDIIRYNHVTGRVRIGIVGKAVYSEAEGVDGIQISEISKDGPMDGSGALEGDIITKIDGQEVETFAEVYNILEKHRVGDKVRIDVYRPSEDRTYDITIELQADE